MIDILSLILAILGILGVLVMFFVGISLPIAAASVIALILALFSDNYARRKI